MIAIEDKPLQQRIGERVRQLRGEKSLVWLSERTEDSGKLIATSNLARIEAGGVNPTATTLERVALALGVHICELFKAGSSREVVSIQVPETAPDTYKQFVADHTVDSKNSLTDDERLWLERLLEREGCDDDDCAPKLDNYDTWVDRLRAYRGSFRQALAQAVLEEDKALPTVEVAEYLYEDTFWGMAATHREVTAPGFKPYEHFTEGFKTGRRPYTLIQDRKTPVSSDWREGPDDEDWREPDVNRPEGSPRN